MFKKYFLIIGLLLFCCPSLAQENNVEALFFYSPTCPHCHNVRAELDNLKSEFSQFQVTEYDVTQEEGNKIFLQLPKIYDQNINGVPVVLINDKIIIGDADSSLNEIRSQIELCLSTTCQNPSEKISSWQAANPDFNPQQQKAIYILIAVGIIIVFIVIIFLFYGRSNPQR